MQRTRRFSLEALFQNEMLPLRTGPFVNIVSAVDLTVSSAVALRTAHHHPRTSGGRVTMVHALKNEPGRMALSGGEAVDSSPETTTVSNSVGRAVSSVFFACAVAPSAELPAALAPRTWLSHGAPVL